MGAVPGAGDVGRIILPARRTWRAPATCWRCCVVYLGCGGVLSGRGRLLWVVQRASEVSGSGSGSDVRDVREAQKLEAR